MKENFEKKSDEEISAEKRDEETLRHKIRILLKADIDPSKDDEFKGVLMRHQRTIGDVRTLIEEEKEKLALEKENKDKERKYYTAHEKR